MGWTSLFYMPPIEVRRGVFYATIGVDLRYTDAVVIEAYGPLEVDLGGLMGETSLPSEIVSILDGWRHRKAFTIRADAVIWQNKAMRRVRDELYRLRDLYLNDYPGGFPDRIRTV